MLNQNVLFYFFTSKGLIIDNIILKSLEKVKESNNSNNLPDYLKPCVSLILKTPISKDFTYSRNDYCYLIFTEFRRIGVIKEKARLKIDKWDYLNNPPLPESEIRSCLKSAYKDKKTHGCNNPMLEEFCLKLGGIENCHYYKQLPKGYIKYSEFDYTNYGWQKVLTPRERLVLFYIIPLIEKKRGFKPGSRIYITCRELEKISGINKRYFSHDKYNKNILDKLKHSNLIEYIPGKRHIWNKTANRIKRTIPIPIPPKCKQNKY